MPLFELHRAQVIRRPRHEVFRFFEDPANLERITPPSLGFKILTPSPIGMAQGTVIDYVVRVAGLPLRWTSAITDYDPPNKFVDVQIKGPYSFWHHAHLFFDCAEGTRMEDHVRYAVPLGGLGRLFEPLLVRPTLERIFDYREEAISKYFGA